VFGSMSCVIIITLIFYSVLHFFLNWYIIVVWLTMHKLIRGMSKYCIQMVSILYL